MLSLGIMILLVLSIFPSGIVTAATPTAEQVNSYSVEVANFVKEKCHGKCENVILLGDDYVVPSFRRNIKLLNWYYFLPFFADSHKDSILTDIGYVQRKAKTFDQLDEILTKQLDGNNYEGKNILLILPDTLSTEQRNSINALKSEFETRFKSHFSEKKSSDIYCNDPQLWDNMNGLTLMVIGTEQNNYAFNCFPFQAGLENRNAAFIDINPWDGRNYAVIFNTDDSLIIDTFTLFIHTETFRGIRSETAYFFKIGTKVAVYSAITLAVLSGVGAAVGIAGAGTLAVTANVVNVAADAAVVTDSCYYDSYKYGESWGGCVKDAVIIIVLPKVLEKTTKYAVSKVLAYFTKFSDDTIRVIKSPNTYTLLKDGTLAEGTAVIREGIETGTETSKGMVHIKAGHIGPGASGTPFKKIINGIEQYMKEDEVIDLIKEATEQGVPDVIHNTDPQKAIVLSYQKAGLNRKGIRVVIDKFIGDIITAYPTNEVI